jgi:hypothetical protein
MIAHVLSQSYAYNTSIQIFNELVAITFSCSVYFYLFFFLCNILHQDSWMSKLKQPQFTWAYFYKFVFVWILTRVLFCYLNFTNTRLQMKMRTNLEMARDRLHFLSKQFFNYSSKVIYSFSWLFSLQKI